MNLHDMIARPPEPGAVPRVPFEALHQGEHVTVTAVLERTAVWERAGARSGERELARLDALEPVGELDWTGPNQTAYDTPWKRGNAAQTGRQASVRSRRLRYGSHRDTTPAGYGG